MIKENFKTISSIANRAVQELGFKDRISLIMDIEYTHDINPLKLNELLNAENGNFAHDICGIDRNFNRQTKTLDNCFLPRFSA